jgi:hypothetical protein
VSILNLRKAIFDYLIHVTTNYPEVDYDLKATDGVLGRIIEGTATMISAAIEVGTKHILGPSA